MAKGSRTRTRHVRDESAFMDEDECMDSDVASLSNYSTGMTEDCQGCHHGCPNCKEKRNYENQSNATAETSSRDKVRAGGSGEIRKASPEKAPETPEAPVKRAAWRQRKSKRGRPNEVDPTVAKTRTRRHTRTIEASVAKVIKTAVKGGRVSKRKLNGGPKNRLLAKRIVRMRGGSVNPPGSKVCRSCKAKERQSNFKFPTKLYQRLLKHYTKGSTPSKASKMQI